MKKLVQTQSVKIRQSPAKKSKWQKFKDNADGHFLMTRPYSLAEYPLTTMVAKTNITPTLEPSLLDGASLAATTLQWAALCWNLESVHKHANRPEISKKVANVAFGVAVTIGAIVNPMTLAFSAMHYLTCRSYAKKEGESNLLGAASFLIRGAGQTALYFFSQCFYTSTLSTKSLLVGGAVGLAIAARNLIGDLRDIKYDKKTFPIVFGETTSMVTASLLKIGACGLLYATFGSVLMGAPLLIESAIGVFYKHHQNMHRISVVGFSATLANIVLANLGIMEATILVNLVYLSSLVGTVFYNKVARASNQDYE
ncbi:MAG: hypothetical protein ABII22_06340 [Candidatus Micrarchaeota archaeon]